MPVLYAEELREFVGRIFRAVGASPEEADQVARLLVEANLTGHDSHGIIRVPGYVNRVREGLIIPGAEMKILHESPCLALVDGGWNFGQIVAWKAMELTIEKAACCGLGAVSVRRCGHVGRLADYTLLAAQRNMIGFMTASGHGRGRSVAPWGSNEAQLHTNPLSWAIPTGAEPLILDMSTSVVAEGKVHVKRNLGEKLPPGWAFDAEGRPATDPAAFYGPPRGALLPLGGLAGHKGFGLSLVVEALSGALSGAGTTRDFGSIQGNALFITAIDVAHFIPLEDFTSEIQTLILRVKGSRPADGPVLMPGEPERIEKEKRMREGIFIEEETWRQITNMAEELVK